MFRKICLLVLGSALLAAPIPTALALQPSAAMLRRLFEQELAGRKREYGDFDARTAQAARDLGMFLSMQGDAASAQHALAEAVRIDEKAFGPMAVRTIADVAELASVSPAGQAEPLWRRAAGSADAAVAARALATLGQMRANSGDAAEAGKFYRQALAKEEAASGPDNLRIAVRLSALARVVSAPEGVGLLERALAINRRRLGARHPQTATVATHLAELLLACERVGEAERYSRDAVAIFEESLGFDDSHVARAATILARVLQKKGQTVEAERMYRLALTLDEHAYGPRHRQTLSDVRELAGFLRETGKNREAAELEKQKLSDPR
jgi:tetratricopeptide (TPR) repeat protein